FLDICSFGVARRERNGAVERPGNDVLYPTLELVGEFRRGLPDQVSLAHARKKSGERSKTSGLGLAAGDPEKVRETGERLRRRIRIGCFGIVDEQHLALAADLFHAMRQAGIAAQALLNL